MKKQNITDLATFIEEDLGRGDVTSESLVPKTREAQGTVCAAEPGVLAGLEEASLLAASVSLEITTYAIDGDDFLAGQIVFELTGAARAVLGIERTMLNVMSHMSGVATATNRAITAVTEAYTGLHADNPPRITATRKTLPGLRTFQKKAVVLGGGLPHRLDLAEAVLIKDNHLMIVTDIVAALARVRNRVGELPIEIEVESLSDALTAAKAGANCLLLDNFEPEGVVEVVSALCSAGLRDAISLEASGGITVGTVSRYADTGVDFISMGSLTMSPSHIDFSLHLTA
tara:strand:+ start:599 stop:1459 length:861 start_codon:yes stop_codon:yes gene_type:complete